MGKICRDGSCREKQKHEKDLELEKRRAIEKKRSIIDKISQKFFTLEKKPGIIKSLTLKSAYKDLINYFIEDENEEVKDWALAKIIVSFNNELIDPKLIHSFLDPIHPHLIAVLEDPDRGKRLRDTAVNALGKIGSDQVVDAILKAFESGVIDHTKALKALIDSGHPRALETIGFTNKKPDS